ncbi:hypothetical protein BC940DRAFT_312858 [Gongronella butleri]|nr:hypothetical protein BC940DRAFT_312858 [Gongronella butleri]
MASTKQQPAREAWIQALRAADALQVQSMIQLGPPSLLSEPIPFHKHEFRRLVALNGDRVPLDDIHDIPPIHFALLQIHENQQEDGDDNDLLQVLLMAGGSKVLNTCFWGDTNLTALELAMCLNQYESIALLKAHGAMLMNENEANDDTAVPGMTPKGVSGATTNRAPSAFQQLRQFAENAGQGNKRLTITDRRQLEVASIAKHSRVKNNPLFKQFESQQPSPSTSPSPTPRRGTPEPARVTPSPTPSKSLTMATNSSSKSTPEAGGTSTDEIAKDANNEDDGKDMDEPISAPMATEAPVSSTLIGENVLHKRLLSLTSEADSEQWFDTNDEYAENRKSRQLMPVDAAFQTIIRPASPETSPADINASAYSSDASETTITTRDTSATRATSLASQRTSMVSQRTMDSDFFDREDQASNSSNSSSGSSTHQQDNNDEVHINDALDHALHTLEPQHIAPEQETEETRARDTIPDETTAPMASHTPLTDATHLQQPIIRVETQYDDDDNENDENDENDDGLALDSPVLQPHSPPLEPLAPSLAMHGLSINDNATVPESMSIKAARQAGAAYAVPGVTQQSGSDLHFADYGKLYVRVVQAQDILLPLPAKATFARCVVSDGRNDFVSSYKSFENTIGFQYECIMDTRPDMLISIGLQLRPDPHVRPLTGLSRMFTSAQRQRETLSGYVHQDEQLVGQSRFALHHMVHACNQNVHHASFDFFNSWYAKSSKERRRPADEQIIKVVGSVQVDLLYLPVTDTSNSSIPPSLQECDLALKIRQWHNTLWISGYMSVRHAGKQMWSRHFYQLIGSRLLEFDTHRNTATYERVYNVTDVTKLTVAAERTLVDLYDQRSSIIFSQDTICEDNRKGFFRIAFNDGSFFDCICDQVQDSELWVKTLKAMIGKVPLSLSFE